MGDGLHLGESVCKYIVGVIDRKFSMWMQKILQEKLWVNSKVAKCQENCVVMGLFRDIVCELKQSIIAREIGNSIACFLTATIARECHFLCSILQTSLLYKVAKIWWKTLWMVFEDGHVYECHLPRRNKIQSAGLSLKYLVVFAYQSLECWYSW